MALASTVEPCRRRALLLVPCGPLYWMTSGPPICLFFYSGSPIFTAQSQTSLVSSSSPSSSLNSSPYLPDGGGGGYCFPVRLRFSRQRRLTLEAKEFFSRRRRCCPPLCRTGVEWRSIRTWIDLFFRWAASSHQHVMAGPATLDPRRAEAASKHVRALNTQFASWVQSQLQNHPAELWEDGIKDYISHASEIMEKFKDVVNWLRQNKAGSTAVSSPSPPNDGKTTLTATVDSKLMVQPGSDNGQKGPITAASSSAFQSSSSQNMFSFSSHQKAPAFSGIFGDKKSMPGDSSKPTFQFGVNNGFSTPNMPSIFSASGAQSFSMQTPTPFSVNQQPILYGNQNTAEASGDADVDAEPEQPSSPSVKKAEEKGIVVVHEAKCKVYVKHDDATKGWKDIGVGQLSIRCKEGAEKASKESTPTIVIRNDVGKILLNALIYKGIKMNVQKNTVASIFHTSDAQSSESGSTSVVARTYLFRLKNEEAATKLSATIKENAPLD